MKRTSLMILILLANLLFFPQRSRILSWNIDNGMGVKQDKILFLSPIWLRAYDGHFIVKNFFRFQWKNSDQIIAKDMLTFKNGNIIYSSEKKGIYKIPFYIESYNNGSGYISFYLNNRIATGTAATDLNGNTDGRQLPSSLAIDTWIIFYLIPSGIILIFLLLKHKLNLRRKPKIR